MKRFPIRKNVLYNVGLFHRIQKRPTVVDGSAVPCPSILLFGVQTIVLELCDRLRGEAIGRKPVEIVRKRLRQGFVNVDIVLQPQNVVAG